MRMKLLLILSAVSLSACSDVLDVPPTSTMLRISEVVEKPNTSGEATRR